MRIALFNALYPTPRQPKIVGGAEVVVRQIAERLVAAGHEVVVVRIAVDGRRQTEDANGVRVEFVPLRNLFTPFGEKHGALAHLAWHLIDDWGSAPRDIVTILDDFRPQIVNSHTLNGLNTHIWRWTHDRGIPVVHVLHDYYLLCPRCSRFKGGRACASTCQSCTLLTVHRRQRSALVDAVVSVSQRTLDLHVNEGLFSRAARYVIPNVANPDIPYLPIGTHGGPLRVGFIGRFAPEKGIDLLVEAAARMPSDTVSLVLAGRVSEAEQARLAALAPGMTLDFLGFVSPKDFYAQVDVVALPSIWEEPGALVLLDAQGAGRPVLTSTLGGMPEMFRRGVTGWTADPSVDGFAAILRSLVENPELVRTAHQRLRERRARTVDDMVAAYSDVYQSLVLR